jgi:hypothetical protein
MSTKAHQEDTTMQKQQSRWKVTAMTRAFDQAAGIAWTHGMLRHDAQPMYCDVCGGVMSAAEVEAAGDTRTFYANCGDCQESV